LNFEQMPGFGGRKPTEMKRDASRRPFVQTGFSVNKCLKQIAQAAQTDFLAAEEWFTVAGADGPAPIAAAVADVVED
jgi:hypothetical protein